jgi:very-short-patch-repair endonuclease
VDVVDVVAELGGVARRAELPVDRSELDAAVACGRLERDSRGLYVLPQVGEAARAARRVGGRLCLLSAALHHGWKVMWPPERPQVVVSRGRKLSATRARGVEVSRAELAPHQVDGIATSVEVTLEQCLRRLPFAQALAVADSALRAGVGPSVLASLADTARGPGSRQLRRVCAQASALAANPFESALRASCLDVPGLAVAPQVLLHGVRPDLVDQRLRIVLEADSFEWHGGRAALAEDARRYNMLVVEGWMVLRFSWEEVLLHPERVRATLVAAVALAEVLTHQVARPRLAA